MSVPIRKVRDTIRLIIRVSGLGRGKLLWYLARISTRPNCTILQFLPFYMQRQNVTCRIGAGLCCSPVELYVERKALFARDKETLAPRGSWAE